MSQVSGEKIMKRLSTLILCITIFSLLSLNNIHSMTALSDKKKLTLLTNPIGKKGGKGHNAVTTSLCAGLKQLGVPFVFNPEHERELTDIVHVIFGVDTLKQAITLKRQGKIKKLLAGPNIVERATEFNYLLGSPEIDVCVVPSEWVKIDYVEDIPSLKDRTHIWYAGVDPQYWKPSHDSLVQRTSAKKSKNVVLYWKGNTVYPDIQNMLIKYGWNPLVIRYGNYTHDEFKKALENAAFAIFVTRTESQGIAMAESWAMNVPTLVWDCQKPLIFHFKIHWPTSSAPYLTKDCGYRWKNIQELEILLQRIDTLLDACSPRAWVLENMTDVISAKMLYDIACGQK